MISGPQIRAARALLGITAKELAERACIGAATIKRFELEQEVPANRNGTLRRVQDALEAAGIEFIGDPINAPGVRLYHAEIV